MSSSILEIHRKRKRKAKTFGFHSFAEPSCSISLTGPFRENIRLFIKECTVAEDYQLQGLPTWCTLLLHKKSNSFVPLYTIEENVRSSSSPFCDHCRCVGWGGHLVSKRRYHLIIPIDDDWNKPLDDEVFDFQTHLLHGVFHSNGFGHLLCINGIEGGSKHLSGREMMDLWDRICTILRTRKITVEDTSKKRSLDLRLLHGVAYGHPWFGRWGYKFCRGGFGVTKERYNTAIEELSSLGLDKILNDFSGSKCHTEIKQIICHYRDMSEAQLITLKDLLRFILIVKSFTPPSKKPTSDAGSYEFFTTRPATRATLQDRANLTKEKSVRCKKFSSAVASMDSRWPARRLEFAAEVIVEALKERKLNNSSHSGMTRQDVRDAARLHIGDTGLLDYVLKSMNNVIVGNYIVRRTVNPATRILEYMIHELVNGDKVLKTEPEVVKEKNPISLAQSPGVDVYSDVISLYKAILLAYPNSESVEMAVQTILDSKHFVKEWPLRRETEQLTLICSLKLNIVGLKSDLRREQPPGVIVQIPVHSTFRELKEVAETALRDTYCIMEQFVVTEIQHLEQMKDGQMLFGLLESGTEIFVRGIGIDLFTPLRYQAGSENWKVKCECGAQDDDGERMVACDICEIWQHTRCSGIEDAELVPPLFVCSCCCDSLAPPKTASTFVGDFYDSFLISTEPNYLMDEVSCL